MNHTSGIPRHIMTPEFKDALIAYPQKTWRPEELVAFVLDAEPLFPAGWGWAYAADLRPPVRPPNSSEIVTRKRARISASVSARAAFEPWNRQSGTNHRTKGRYRLNRSVY